MSGGTIALALSAAPLWLKLMLPLAVFPLVYLIYEAFAHGETIFSAEGEMYLYAARIASLLPVKVVAFGHTHKPHLRPIRPPSGRSARRSNGQAASWPRRPAGPQSCPATLAPRPDSPTLRPQC